MTRRRGFTLIEVMVAITLAGIVLLLVSSIVGAVVVAGDRLGASWSGAVHRANAERWLAGVLESIDVGENAAPFEGTAERATFDSWLLTADGWHERAAVTLLVEAGELRAEVDSEPAIVLVRGADRIAFDYLTRMGAGAPWVTAWRSFLRRPFAMRLRVRWPDGTADTMVFALGRFG